MAYKISNSDRIYWEITNRFRVEVCPLLRCLGSEFKELCDILAKKNLQLLCNLKLWNTSKTFYEMTLTPITYPDITAKISTAPDEKCLFCFFYKGEPFIRTLVDCEEAMLQIIGNPKAPLKMYYFNMMRDFSNKAQ